MNYAEKTTRFVDYYLYNYVFLVPKGNRVPEIKGGIQIVDEAIYYIGTWSSFINFSPVEGEKIN